MDRGSYIIDIDAYHQPSTTPTWDLSLPKRGRSVYCFVVSAPNVREARFVPQKCSGSEAVGCFLARLRFSYGGFAVKSQEKKSADNLPFGDLRVKRFVPAKDELRRTAPRR